MTSAHTFRCKEQVAEVVDQLARFAVALRHERLPATVQQRLDLMLTDLLGVTVAGVRTPELRALVRSWAAPPGEVSLLGTGLRTQPEVAAYLAAIAACALELDEGNKHAAGHPAAHVVFSAVAAAQLAREPVSGARFLSAVAAGYEVAARFGRATARHPQWHTHGHWGATGAACAAALLWGSDAAQVAAAIDAATGLMHVTPWETVLSGDFTRNLWIAGANRAGLDAARLALAGVVHNAGNAAASLGDLVGTLTPATLVDELGERWLTAEGYLKRHSSCSYTHAAVDLVQSLRAAAWNPDDVAEVRVRIHSLAAPLLRRHPHNRLAAMFSLPFVVATAVVSGRVDPDTMEPGTPAFQAAEAFSRRVHVEVDAGLDRHLPRLRCTEVEVELHDGTAMSLAAPNPVGDTDHFPLTHADVTGKLVALIGADRLRSVTRLVAAIPSSPSVGPLLAAGI